MTPLTNSGLPPAVKGLSATSFFNDVASEMVYPLLPAFIISIGGNAALLGALDGASDLASALIKWVSGRWSDRPGWRRPLILVGYATAVLVRPLIALASAAWQVLGFRIVDRVGKGLRTPARDALLAEVTPRELRSRAYGFHRAADHGGAVLGSLIAWYVLQRGVNVPTVIQLSLIPGVIAFVVLWIVLRQVRHQDLDGPRGGAGAAHQHAGGSREQHAGFRPIIVALALLTLARIPEAIILLRLQQLGVAVAMIPLVWALLHVVRSVMTYPAGAVTDRVGARTMVALSSLVAAAVMAGLGISTSAWAAVTLLLLFGFVAALSEPAERSLISLLSPRQLGRGFGAYHAITGLASLPAAVAFGALMDAQGGRTAFLVSAVTLLAATLIWSGMSRRLPSARS